MSQRAFRLLIILKWLLVPLILVSSLWMERFLPLELSDYIQARRNAEPTNRDWVTFVSAIIFLFFSVIISVGLFRFRKWARKLLLPSYIAALLILSFNEPVVEIGLASALIYVSSVIDGVILTLVYYSPLKEVFELGSE